MTNRERAMNILHFQPADRMPAMHFGYWGELLEKCAEFALCYHKCGASAADMTDSLAELPADIYRFGNAVDMKKALSGLPKDRLVTGNVNPVLFRNSSPEEVRAAVRRVYGECSRYDNFMISSGCDIPAASAWENIDAYFDEVGLLYA